MFNRMITVGRVAATALCLGVAAPHLVAQAGQDRGNIPSDSTHRGMRGGRHGGPGAELLKGITLTADQQAQVQAIRQRYRDAMRAAMDSARSSGGQAQPNRKQMRQAMREHMQAEQNEVRNVLTPDQQKVFDQNLQQLRARMQQHMQEHGQGGRRPQG